MSETAVLSVSGMSCGHCVASVEKAAGGVPGVTEVAVDLTAGRVTVTYEPGTDLDEVEAAIENMGYTVEK